MCELYVGQGVTTVVATPHMCDPRFDVSVEAVRRGVGELSEACRRRGLHLTILPGAEVRLQPELLDMFDAGEALTLADTGDYLLIELPPQIVPRMESVIFELALRGITPILGHPERNLELWRKPERLVQLVEYGCLVQVSSPSLLGAFGPIARRAAERLLKGGLVHVVASDAHFPRGRLSPQAQRTAELLVSMMGDDAARRLLQTNPTKIVTGESLELRALGRDERKDSAIAGRHSIPPGAQY